MEFIHEAVIFLIAAIIAVPLFTKLGFGSVLGFLVAGIVIGPWGFAFITGVGNILHFAELGVVFLLFLIGLELQPRRLWVLRHSIFGLGTAQVILSAIVLMLVGWLLGLTMMTALVVGLALSLSSTAFVIQLLAEKKELTTVHGRSAFAILLFQDIAVIPMLALLPLLGIQELTEDKGTAVSTILIGLFALITIIAAGHYLLRPVFRVIAAAGGKELFTATALLVVIGAALLMEMAGLSMALGAFMAGVLLADSEYRHELQANIEPFKGLLLGLFFIAVGMSVNIGLIGGQPLMIAALVLGLIVVKVVVLFVLARLFGLQGHTARNLSTILPQGGEFAFVLFGVAVAYQVMDQGLVDVLIVVVTLSMAMTPVLYAINERFINPWFEGEEQPAFDTIEETGNPVIIAGFGRVGQIVGRILRVQQIPFTALEINPTQVDFVRKFGGKLYYGDASRVELLRAAHAEQAKLIVIAIDDVESSIKTVEAVKMHFPKLEIIARARNRHHAHLLMDQDVKAFVREVFLSSIELTRETLNSLGYTEQQVKYTIDTFKKHDEQTLKKQLAIHHDESKLIQSVKDAAEELEILFESDAKPDDTLSNEK